jgi:hypothetical protein
MPSAGRERSVHPFQVNPRTSASPAREFADSHREAGNRFDRVHRNHIFRGSVSRCPWGVTPV